MIEMEKCIYFLLIIYYVIYIQNNLYDFFIDGFSVFKKRLMIKIFMLFNVKRFYNSYVEILVYDLFKMVL